MGPEGRGTLCNACGLRYRKKLKVSLPPKAANSISLLLNSDQQPITDVSDTASADSPHLLEAQPDVDD